MSGPRFVAVAPLAVVVALAIAPPAVAHDVRYGPVAGDTGTTFVFAGTAWEPFGLVTWQYFRRATDVTPSRSGTIRLRRAGSFTFRWTDFRVGLRHRICFSQFDTRLRAAGTAPGRFFRKCGSFWVAQPSAYFMPVTGDPGVPFALAMTGFVPGRQVTIRLTRPSGVLDTFRAPVRTSAAFVTPGPGFDPIYVPRGGAVRYFPGDPSVERGLYTAEITDGALTARAAVRVR